MSSHAATISAMITTHSAYQLQLGRPTPQTLKRCRSREPRDISMFSKGNNKVIGVLQVSIGFGILIVQGVSWANHIQLPRVAQGMSVAASLVFTTSGLVSAFAKGHKRIRAAVIVNSISCGMALLTIIICSYVHYSIWDTRSILVATLSLSILEFLLNVLCAVYGCKALRLHKKEPAASQDALRDGSDRKTTSSRILHPEPESTSTQP